MPGQSLRVYSSVSSKSALRVNHFFPVKTFPRNVRNLSLPRNSASPAVSDPYHGNCAQSLPFELRTIPVTRIAHNPYRTNCAQFLPHELRTVPTTGISHNPCHRNCAQSLPHDTGTHRIPDTDNSERSKGNATHLRRI